MCYSEEGMLLVPETVTPTCDSWHAPAAITCQKMKNQAAEAVSAKPALCSSSLHRWVEPRIILIHYHFKNFSTAAGELLQPFSSPFLFFFLPLLILMTESFTQNNVLLWKTLLVQRVVVLLLFWFSCVYTRHCKYVKFK